MKDVSKDHPDIVKRLQDLLAAQREIPGDEREQVQGKENRPIGHVTAGKPLWEDK